MRETTPEIPKPLVEIGGRPILWHVMSLYAGQGLSRFVLLLGHGAEEISEFVAELSPEWDVTCIDTGTDTPTGGRLAAAREYLDEGTFCATYADGLADIDVGELLSFHRRHPGAATVTVVRPTNPWGVVDFADDGRVDGFVEKPRLAAWVNGGFFAMEPRALASIGPEDALEEAPLEALAAAGELYAYRHDGFWQCMDTYKDTLVLNSLWDGGNPPWRAGAALAGVGRTRVGADTRP